MKAISDQLRQDFLEELIAEGDLWRIFRKSTFLDLIRLEFIAYGTDGGAVHLKKVFNNAIKYSMFDSLSQIDISGSATDILSQLNNNYPLLVNTYNKIVSKLIVEYQNIAADQFDLSNNVLYLKMLNQLELNIEPDNIVSEIAWATYRILTTL